MTPPHLNKRWPKSTNITVLETPCREYQGARLPWGYGRRSKRPPYYVHVWVWEQVNGLIPEGMKVLHRCDNPPCFRYDHLFLGTPADNTADMMAKGRYKTSRGEQRANAKLTWAKVAEIRTRISAGEPQIRLAAEFDVPNQLISEIWLGQAWHDGSWVVSPQDIQKQRDANRPRGEAHKRGKLTLEQVHDIRSSTELARVVAAQFGISIRQVWRIRSGENWLPAERVES